MSCAHPDGADVMFVYDGDGPLVAVSSDWHEAPMSAFILSWTFEKDHSGKRKKASAGWNLMFNAALGERAIIRGTEEQLRDIMIKHERTRFASRAARVMFVPVEDVEVTMTAHLLAENSYE